MPASCASIAPRNAFPGVAIAITAEDVPGQLDIGPVVAGDPLLADGKVDTLASR
ncbi:hypothetical protein SSTU70S_02226 [Stutzerimonas stutzeri]